MMTETHFTPAGGRCTCGAVCYRMTREPMIVHCCHCSWCQRETGSAFAVNAVVEADCVEVTGSIETITTPSHSGKGQKIARCPACRVALWSNYAGSGETIRFVRVGTMEEPGRFPPDIHIFTSTKLSWVVLPSGVPAMAEYYIPKEVWSETARTRWLASRIK